MTILLLLCGLTAVALPSIRPRGLVSAQPRWCVRLATAALVLGLTSFFAGLLLSIGVGAVHLLSGTHVATDHLAPEGDLGAAVAAAGFAYLTIRATRLARAVHRTRRAVVAVPWVGAHHQSERYELVVLPTDRILAYAVPGSQPQIVISEGLRDQVDADLLRFVIDHERAHLSAGDHRSLVVALAVEALLPALPFAVRSAATVRVAVERAADEQAAGCEPTRRRALAAQIDALGRLRGTACSSEMLQFRSRQLVVSSGGHRSWVGGAALGVLVVAMAAAAVIAHAASDAAPYLAML